jgi:hypothetical protein
MVCQRITAFEAAGVDLLLLQCSPQLEEYCGYSVPAFSTFIPLFLRKKPRGSPCPAQIPRDAPCGRLVSGNNNPPGRYESG